MNTIPRFVKEGWLDDSQPYEGWKLKSDAPEWAKREFKEVIENTELEEPIECKSDKNCRVRIY